MTIKTERVEYEEYAYSAKTKVTTNEDVVTEYQKVVSEKVKELSEKLQNGETETSYQIGAQSFTEQEWNKLMDEYDYMQDEVKKLMRERHEELDKKRQVIKEEQEKLYEDEISNEQVKLLLEDKSDIKLDSDALFSICHVPTGETANVYKAESYSVENPVYIVKGKDINGNDYEQEINVNEIDTNNCSYVEILAWSVHTKYVTPEEYLKICRMIHGAGDSSYLDKIDYTEVVRKLMEEAKAVGEMATYMEYKELLQKLEAKGSKTETKVTKVILKPLRPVDNWLEVVKRPLPLASYSKVDTENNSVNIAVGTKIAIHDGYILTVKSDKVEVSKMGKPSADYRSYAMAHSMAQTLEVMLRNAGGMICDVGRNKATWERWDINVTKILKYIGIDPTKDFTVNGTTYTENEAGYMESEVSLAYKDTFKNQSEYVTEDEESICYLEVDEEGNTRIKANGKMSSFDIIGDYESFYKSYMS